VLVVGATTVIQHCSARRKARRPWLTQLLKRKSPKLAAVALANKDRLGIAWKLMGYRRKLRRKKRRPPRVGSRSLEDQPVHGEQLQRAELSQETCKMMSRWCDQSIPERETFRIFQVAPLEVAVSVLELFVAGNHLGQRSCASATNRPEHMDASDLIKHCKNISAPCRRPKRLHTSVRSLALTGPVSGNSS